MDYVIKANNVYKAYGKKVALGGIDLAIPPGRIVGLIGPNGAGKTTLLKSLLGLLQQTSGNIQVLGMAIDSKLLVAVYLLACLYTDRKDGSILFWKSLPVSETRNLGTKLLVAVLVAPSIAMLAVLAAQLVFMMVISIHFAGSGAVTLGEIWQGASFFSNLLGVWFLLVGLGLWLLPVYAWLLVASAWAKKAPFLSALTPLVVAVILERLFLGSSHFGRMLAQRLSGPDTVNLPELLLALELWIGFLISALLVAVAVWLRNNRYQL